MNERGEPVLYALVTGSPAARDIGKLVDLAHADGWDVCVIAPGQDRPVRHGPAVQGPLPQPGWQ